MTTDDFILEKKCDKLKQAWGKLNRFFDIKKEISFQILLFKGERQEFNTI